MDGERGDDAGRDRGGEARALRRPGAGVTAEFNCEGCGAHVFALGRPTAPASMLCATCEWLCEFVPEPEGFERIYRRLKTGSDRQSGA